MRFATLAFATGAFAQITVIKPIIEKLNADVGGVNTALKGYTTGDGADVLAASKKLLDEISSGVTTAKGSSDLTQNDALQLTGPFQGLQSATENIIKELSAKKCNFASSGKASEVLSSLQDQLTATKALAEAITSKVPPPLQSVAAQLSSGIATAIQSGVDSFKDLSSCPAAPAAPAAPGGGSGSSTAPTSGANTTASTAGAPATAPTPGAPAPEAPAPGAPTPEAPTTGPAPGASTTVPTSDAPATVPISGTSNSTSAAPINGTSAAPVAKPTTPTLAGSNTHSNASANHTHSNATGAAPASNRVPAYAGVVAIAALFGAAF
ncbi:cell wall manno protein MnpA [Venturia nashicola]|uniref:Cell wall mannoprotein 1 n=1 Tax=Venturia nashicola TaxID=86259 RepID=A0A4Z1NEV1_9PEZI|nr:cell wall manno protein MnpA [Venturia nashicola]TLD19033.1 cell wall manno protein MnpA [Venturia nashicola]